MSPRRLATSAAAAFLAIALGLPALAASAEEEIELVPVDVGVFDISSVAPADWPHIGLGQYARGTPPDDWTLLALQVFDGSAEEVRSTLQARLAIPAELTQTGSASTALGDWTLHRFDTRLPAPVSGELAVLELEESAYLVLLLTEPEAFEALRESVFIPAIEAYARLEPEPTTDPASVGYRVEDVAFAGGDEGVMLAGTLTLPDTPGRHPVVLLISGSGGQDRDESLKPMAVLKPFALIADALTSAGVGVLRYDDRGVAASTGSRSGLTLDGIAADARAAIDFLESHADVDAARIGLLGHSEGGIVSAMLGASDPRIAFIVDMAGPAADPMAVMRAQNLAVLRTAGQEAAVLEQYGDFLDELYPLVRVGDEDAAEALASGFFADVWESTPADVRELAGERDAFVATQVDALVDPLIRSEDTAPWWRSFFEYEPMADWSRITKPVLGLFGGKDVQVLADQNAPLLEEALEAAGNEDFEVVVFPDANHLFQAAETGALTEYSALAPEFTADFLPTVVAWVVEQAEVGA